MTNEELRRDSERYRYLYRTNQCTRGEAKNHIIPYLNAVNDLSKEIAKKI